MHTMTGGRENRKHKRILMNHAVQLISNDQSFNLKMINLSEGGVGALSDDLIPANSQITVEFQLRIIDEIYKFSCLSTIVHTTPIRKQHMLGIRFDDISPYQAKKIATFINRQSRRY